MEGKTAVVVVRDWNVEIQKAGGVGEPGEGGEEARSLAEPKDTCSHGGHPMQAVGLKQRQHDRRLGQQANCEYAKLNQGQGNRGL